MLRQQTLTTLFQQVRSFYTNWDQPNLGSFRYHRIITIIFPIKNQRTKLSKGIKRILRKPNGTFISYMDVPKRSSSGWVCLHSYLVESRGTFTHMWWMTVNVWRYFRQDYTWCPKVIPELSPAVCLLKKPNLKSEMLWASLEFMIFCIFNAILSSI